MKNNSDGFLFLHVGHPIVDLVNGFLRLHFNLSLEIGDAEVDLSLVSINGSVQVNEHVVEGVVDVVSGLLDISLCLCSILFVLSTLKFLPVGI